MRRIVVGVIVSAACFAAFQRLAPVLGRKAMQKCENMFEQMPEDFPPKRLMRSLEEIQEQNARILRHLEGTGRTVTPGPTDEVVEAVAGRGARPAGRS